MFKIVKKTAMASVLLAIASSTACAEEYVLKFAGIHPINHNASKYMEQVKSDIEAADVGLSVKLFPAGQLGSGEELLDDALRGNIDIVHSYIYPNRARALEVVSLPFLASSKEEIEDIYLNQESQFNQILKETFSSLGLELFGTSPEGLIGVVANEKPENYATADQKGMNIRVWGSQIAKATVESLGFRSTTMNWGEVFAALQSGAVDGAICCTAQATYTTFAQSDVGSYFIPYNSFTEVTAYFASGRTWEKLNDDQKAVVQKAIQKASVDFANSALAQEEEFTAKLKEAGYEVLEITDAQRAELSSVARDAVRAKAEALVGKEILERLNY